MTFTRNENCRCIYDEKKIRLTDGAKIILDAFTVRKHSRVRRRHKIMPEDANAKVGIRENKERKRDAKAR